MERFVAVQNIERFRRLIAREEDPVLRWRLVDLLAAEEAKLEEVDHPHVGGPDPAARQ